MSTYALRLRAAIVSRKKSDFDDLCFEIEYDQLTRERWSPEVFEFVMAALRNPVVCMMRGSGSFVMTLYNDFEKLTDQQRMEVLILFGLEACNFGDEMLRHYASDMIARRYSPKLAFETFVQWAEVANSPNHRHMAMVGIEILLIGRKLENKDLLRAKLLLNRLKISESG